MRQLLLATCREVADAETRTLSEVRFEKVIVHHRSILKEGRKELPSRLSRKVKRAVCPHPRRKNCSMHSSSTRMRSNALQSTARYRSSIIAASATFRWRKSGRIFTVPSETSLTLMLYCRTSSYQRSMSCQGCNSLAAIQIALNGNTADMLDHTKQNQPYSKSKTIRLPIQGRQVVIVYVDRLSVIVYRDYVLE